MFQFTPLIKFRVHPPDEWLISPPVIQVQRAMRIQVAIWDEGTGPTTLLTFETTRQVAGMLEEADVHLAPERSCICRMVSQSTPISALQPGFDHTLQIRRAVTITLTEGDESPKPSLSSATTFRWRPFWRPG
jgi:hypothetical protein